MKSSSAHTIFFFENILHIYNQLKYWFAARKKSFIETPAFVLIPIVSHDKFITYCYASKQLVKTADSDTVSTCQVSSVQLVTDKKLEAFNKA